MLKSESVNQWLRDAHAMESQAEQLLSGQARRLERHPQISAHLERQVALARTQRQRIEACMERRQISSSTVKDMAGQFTASMQNLSGLFVEDEIVKGMLALYTFEQMSVASYVILEAAAGEEGDTETARSCAQSRAEEEELCAWLKEHLGEIAISHLHEAETA